MVRGNKMPSRRNRLEKRYPPRPFIGAFSGAVAWWVIYRCCPKPPVLDKFLEWWFNGRHDSRQQRATTVPIPDGGDDADPARDNNDTAWRPASPTQSIETIIP